MLENFGTGGLCTYKPNTNLSSNHSVSHYFFFLAMSRNLEINSSQQPSAPNNNTKENKNTNQQKQQQQKQQQKKKKKAKKAKTKRDATHNNQKVKPFFA